MGVVHATLGSPSRHFPLNQTFVLVERYAPFAPVKVTMMTRPHIDFIGEHRAEWQYLLSFAQRSQS